MLRKQISVLGRRLIGKITSMAQYMTKKGFDLKEILSHGTSGWVIKMENSKGKSIFDMKPVSLGELNIWRTLDHQNIFKLVSAE